MIAKIKISLFFLTLIAFLFSATLGFASYNAQLFGTKDGVILMHDLQDKDDDDDDQDKDDDDDDDKHK